MYPTLHTFSEALHMPELSLRTLGGCEVMLNLQGLPALHRTGMTIEAEIRFSGRNYLLALPLSPEVGKELERTIATLERLHHRAWAPLRLLPDELQWQDTFGRPVTASLILEELPGEPLSAVIEQLDPQPLNQALGQLAEDLKTLQVAHNNLKIENLYWHENRLIPIRPWYAVPAGEMHRDRKALEALRRTTDELPILSDCEAEYEADDPNPLTWLGHEFEGLICFSTEEGYGFMDRDEQVVIEPRFLWAEDFHEGRAVVETEEGMGLIDRTGQFILPPDYDMVEYLYERSIVRALREGLWATFDITGAQTSPFLPIEEHEQHLA